VLTPSTGNECVAVLQCVAVRCSVLCCSVLQCVAVCCMVLRCVAMCCGVVSGNKRISTPAHVYVVTIGNGRYF